MRRQWVYSPVQCSWRAHKVRTHHPLSSGTGPHPHTHPRTSCASLSVCVCVPPCVSHIPAHSPTTPRTAAADEQVERKHAHPRGRTRRSRGLTPARELPQTTVIAFAANARFFTFLYLILERLREMPNAESNYLVVYDLGLEKEQHDMFACSVPRLINEIRYFPFDEYPSHVRRVSTRCARLWTRTCPHL